MKPRVKLAILCALSYAVSVFPLLVTFFANWEKYTVSYAATLRLTAGGVIALALLLGRTLGKSLPKGIGGTLVLFLLAFLLEAIISDLVLLLGMFLLGECMDAMFFRRKIKQLREHIVIVKTADATAERVEAVIRRYSGGGRV